MPKHIETYKEKVEDCVVDPEEITTLCESDPYPSWSEVVKGNVKYKNHISVLSSKTYQVMTIKL